MVCFQNSRNRSSTAREEPATRRINDVNPRNGSATSLANSQSSPSPRPTHLPPAGAPLFLSRRFRAFPSSPLEPPSSVAVSLLRSGPTRHDPTPRRDPAGPLPSLLARFVARRLHVLTTLSCRPYSSSPLPLTRTLLRRPHPPLSVLASPRNSEITDYHHAGTPARNGA